MSLSTRPINLKLRLCTLLFSLDLVFGFPTVPLICLFYARAPVPERCCTCILMQKKVNKPSCLPAISFTGTPSKAGVRLEIAHCKSSNYYIGIWYGGKVSEQTPVWVANREIRVRDIYSSELKVSDVAVLEDTRNLLLRDGPNSSTPLRLSNSHGQKATSNGMCFGHCQDKNARFKLIVGLLAAAMRTRLVIVLTGFQPTSEQNWNR
ncbi:hypothetical protein J1N35_015555 [Gossypium stocksii]|uniref:Uncharacterized protein n=1 Tax=Gossypium stocksii TaxID=47602 RepID=A0A9D3VYK9_9ROSI|nr:hypothetical protein J1N35_015555 [Gossypium stocksii]